MSERKVRRDQIVDARIRYLNSVGVCISGIVKDTGKSALHVSNTIKRDPSKE